MLERPLIRYVLPLVAPVIALLAHIVLALVIGKDSSFPFAFLYLIAVFCAAWFGGHIPGVLASVFTMVLLPYLSNPQFHLRDVEFSKLVPFAFVSLLVSQVAHGQRRARTILRTSNEELDRRVQVRTQDLARAVEALQREVEEHEKTEQALRESEARVDFALDAAGIGRWDLDLTTWTATRSLRHDLIFGYDALLPLWTQAQFLDHVVPEDRDMARQEMSDAIANARTCEFECRICRRDGVVRWVWIRGKIRHDGAGVPVGLLGSIRDITDRKEAEEAARRWEQVIRHARFGVAIVNPQTETLELVNPAYARMHGYSADELKGKALPDMAAPAERAGLARRIETLRESGHNVFESTHVRKDGTPFPVLLDVTALTDEQGKVLLWAGYVQDMTAHKAAEEKVLETNERLIRVLETLNDGFIAVDHQWRATYVNHRAAEMLRQPPAALLGVSIWNALPEALNDAPGAQCRRAMQDRVPVQVEFFYKPAKTWFDLNAHPTPDGLALFMRDVTEPRRLAEQLRQAQKMEAVGRLAGGIAHDFNNLLTVITGYSDLLFQELPTESSLRETVSEISSASRRASEVTSGLLAFSRQQLTERSVLNPNDLLRGVEKMLRRLIREDVQIVLALTPGLWDVDADRGQLEQVIMNLAVNARDAMPEGGTLTIETQNVELDEVQARGHLGVPPGEYTLIAVSDTGSGMDKETQSRIFEPFFTTKEQGKGTGLGLAVVYGILQQNQGSISVYSELGRGSTFKVFLPRSTRNQAPAPEIASSPHVVAKPGGETILLVEDDDSLRKLTSRLLERGGFSVLTARSGREALEICDRQSASIDLILSDMVMPQMSGQQLAAEIRSRYPKLSMLFMSGYTENAIASQTPSASGFHFLGKPFTAKALILKVREVLGQRAQTA